jgi:LPPG:FO 2-phospho-L-lactate transferase
MLVALAGGVGAARMLRGVLAVVPPEEVTAIVNTGDDVVLHGLHVSPDLDTVTYTLAEAIDPERGWGLAGETWAAMEALERYAGNTWFRLGDRDLATHMYRTQRLRDGASLSTVTAEIAAAWKLPLTLLPMSDDRVETRVTVAGEGEIGFQEYFVGRQHSVPITGVRFAGIETAGAGPGVLDAVAGADVVVSSVRFDGVDVARPAPGLLDAIVSADRVLICPSNPIVSIGPILAVEGIRAAVEARRDDAVAVSPIVAGAALKGPADRMLTELGHEASVVGVARLYAPLAATLVIDEADAALASDVERAGMRCVVAPAIMRSLDAAAALAATALAR